MIVAPREVVATLIDAWERCDAAAVAACFADDGVWHNMPYRPLSGRAAIAAAVDRFLGAASKVEFRMHHVAEIAPGIVVTERNDVFAMNDGRRIDIPVMGIFEIVDGKVQAWRDYFDSRVMEGPVSA